MLKYLPAALAALTASIDWLRGYDGAAFRWLLLTIALGLIGLTNGRPRGRIAVTVWCCLTVVLVLALRQWPR